MFKKIIIVIVALLIIVFSAAYLFLSFAGKNMIIKKLTEITKKDVSIGYFNVSPLLKIQLYNVNIEGLVRINTVYVSTSLVDLLSGELVFKKIRCVNPVVTLEKIAPEVKDTTPPSSAPAAEPAQAKPAETKVAAVKPQPSQPKVSFLLFKRIIIENGTLVFIDKTVGNGGLKITAKKIYADIKNLYQAPDSVITNFELQGSIPWHEGKNEGTIKIDGWLNPFKKDMQAVLKITDLDGVQLYPYYSTWVNLEKARIEKAKLNFSSDIHGLNNEINAKCHLELTEIVFTPRTPEQKEEKEEKIATVVLGILKATSDGGVYVDFNFKTKMDSPQFGLRYIKTAVEDKIQAARDKDAMKPEDYVAFPAKVAEKTVKSIADLMKAVISGTLGVGSEIKKSVEGTFKKDQPQAK
jgi:hypothetical protein